MERIIVCDMLVYCKKNKLISPEQHGFLSKRSTVTNLLECLNDWCCALANRESVVVAYLDFQKAFDSVCHTKLFSRLNDLGISGVLLKFIKNLLLNRTQRTRVGNELSDPIDLISGVIQGSCIGPLLFILFVNSITKLRNGASSICKLYADDVKLYTVYRSDLDLDRLQQCLDEIAAWSVTWQLPISVQKCSILKLGTKTPACGFYLHHTRLQESNSVKDLGVIMDDQLKFITHVNSIVAKAQSRANLIFKCFVSRDLNTLLHAFIVYVRPLLEYASPVWNPHHKYAVAKIESVQRRFTKRLPGLFNEDYKTRLTKLNLPSLERRRLIYDLVTLYKIQFDLCETSLKSSLVLKNNDNMSTRGNPYRLHCQTFRSDVGKYSFVSRVVNVWNCLPPSVVNFSSLNCFKRTVKNAELSLFTEF